MTHNLILYKMQIMNDSQHIEYNLNPCPKCGDKDPYIKKYYPHHNERMVSCVCGFDVGVEPDVSVTELINKWNAAH